MIAGFGLVYGSHNLLDRVAPPWLAMGIAVFGTIFAAFYVTARASAPVRRGSSGVILGTIATVFVIEPEGSAIAAGLLGMFVGFAAAALMSPDPYDQQSAATATSKHDPARARPAETSSRPPTPSSAVCQVCNGEGFLRDEWVGGSAEGLDQDIPDFLSRVPCYRCRPRRLPVIRRPAHS